GPPQLTHALGLQKEQGVVRVRCIAENLTAEQAAALYHPHPAPSGHTYAVRLGAEYTVFDITCANPLAFVGIASEVDLGIELLYPTPLCLFEITDPSIPSIWVARIRRDGVLCLEPPSFYEHYYEDLSNAVPRVVEDFRRVRAQIEQDLRSVR